MIDNIKIKRALFALLFAGLFFIIPSGVGAEESLSVSRGIIYFSDNNWPAFSGWTGAVNVAKGDLNANGSFEIVATMGSGGGPHVRIFNSEGRLLGQFDAYHPNFRGGVNLAVGDVNADGRDEIITGAGPGGGPHVRVFDGRGQVIEQWFAFNEQDHAGVSVAVRHGEVIASSMDNKEKFELNIPFHRQEHSLSCEVASLKSALAYKGVDVSESELISYQPISKPREYKEGIWGDPSKGYVGDIDGSQPSLTGYGIYWQPIADLASQYRPAETFRKADWDQLVEYVRANQAVIIWGNYVNNPRTLIWQTAEGADVLGFVGEHTYALLGWEGDPNHPDNVILLDPVRGRLVMAYGDFMKNWSFLDYSGVVVY